MRSLEATHGGLVHLDSAASPPVERLGVNETKTAHVCVTREPQGAQITP